MLQQCAHGQSLRLARRWSRSLPRTVTFLLVASAATTLVCGADGLSTELTPVKNTRRTPCVTNASQFRALSAADYLAGCDFQLSGVITLVDTNRELVVLQDATGAVALNFPLRGQELQAGQLVTLDGTNCCPLFARFPSFPYRPSGRELRDSFEAPQDQGNYYLTRMRGYLHPPVSGEYTFWIASDNSSELWLSPDADPSNARRIASMQRYGWANPRDWSHFPSQRSEPIQLKAGETYYLEALHEQNEGGDNLAVAWMGPSLPQAVIDGSYLTPPEESLTAKGRASPSKGILREYWTNFFASDLTGLGDPRAFESALTVREVRATPRGTGAWPEPTRLTLNQPWRATNNYLWVETEGLVKFTGTEGDVTLLELSDGQATVQVRAPRSAWNLPVRAGSVRIRVRGVCEGVYDQKGDLVPGLIWAAADESIEAATTNAVASATNQPPQIVPVTSSAMVGFYVTRGVVTFADWVLGTNYIFVQEDAKAVLVSPADPALRNRFKVGQGVELAGALEPGKHLPVLRPLAATDLGQYAMPAPITQPFSVQFSGNRDGRWSELEGVVHSVANDGRFTLLGKDGRAYLWVGQTPSRDLASYVDAKVRARGVLLFKLLDAPLLLVPSGHFIEVSERAPEDPFATPSHSINELLTEDRDTAWTHRVRVMGEVTYRDTSSFFLQDASGGIRVQTSRPASVEVGHGVEVVAFPSWEGFAAALSEPVVRPARLPQPIGVQNLDWNEALSAKQSGTLVQVTATLLARITNGLDQVLELQGQQRAFAATLAPGRGNLPEILPGSRLQVTGVCNSQTSPPFPPGHKPDRAQFVASLNLLLRSPYDVVVLNGPPWWTWKRTVTLVGMLLTVLAIALLWIHFLRRRLERQQAAQLAFSRNVLERLEDERRRIAVNLHDSLGQSLLLIKNHALWAKQGPPEEPHLERSLEEISNVTSQAIEEVRRITHGLRPYQLDRLGLTQAIRTLVSQASENTSIQFASRVENIDGLFDKDIEIHVYRIVQEAVTNIVKHSGATEATVVVKSRAPGIALSIRDNGRGFDPAQPSSQSHDVGHGLGGITERVRILGGTLAIDSKPGESTSLTVEVPLLNHEHGTGTNDSDRR